MPEMKRKILVHIDHWRSYELQILCDTKNKTWEPLTDINLLVIMSVAEYIHAKGLTSLTRCKWARKYNMSNPS